MGFWDTVAQENAKGGGSNSNNADAIGSFFSQTVPDTAKSIFDSTIGSAGNTVGNAFSLANTQMKQNAVGDARAAAQNNSDFLDKQVKANQISQDEADKKKKADQAKIDQLDKDAKVALANSNQIDPTKAAGDAANTALNVATLGGVGLAKDAALGAGEAVAKSGLGNAAKTVLSHVGEGQLLGAGYGAANTAATKGNTATQQDYSSSVGTGAMLGGILGIVPGVKAGVKVATNPAESVISNAPKVAESVSPPTAKPTAAPSQVVNGTGGGAKVPDLDPFNPSKQPILPNENQSGTTTQLSPQDASSAPFDSSNQGQMTLDQLGQSANRPVGQTPAEFFKTQSDAKNMAQDVTPGNQTIIQGNMGKPANEVTPGQTPELTPAQQAAEALTQGKSNITQKPLQVTDTPAPVDKYTENANSEAPLGAKLLTDVNNRIADLKASGKEVPQELQNAQDQLNKAAGSVSHLTGDYVNAKDEPQGFFNKVVSKAGDLKEGISGEWENVTNRFSSKAGAPGAQLANDLQQGAKFKQTTRADTQSMIDSVKDFTASGQKIGVGEAKQQVNRVAKAVESGDTSILKTGDQPAYDALKNVSDYFNQKRQEMGRAVKGGSTEAGSYVTHANMSSDKNISDGLAEAMLGKDKTPDALSMFSKERKGNQELDVKDVKTLITNYANSMTNDLAYGDAIKKFAANKDQMPASMLNNTKNMLDFEKDLKSTLGYAMHGNEENAISRVSGKALNTMSQNALYTNVGNEFKNLTDQTRNGQYLSPGHKDVGTINPDIMKEFQDKHGNFTFGIHQNAAENPSKLSQIGKAADKLNTDRFNIKLTNQKGLQDGFNRSTVYQDAIKAGKTPSEAQDIAWNSPDKDQIIRNTNYVAGNQAFGNDLNRAATFTKGKPLLGLLSPKAVSTFASYPISTSMNFIRNMDPSGAQALEAFGRGEILGSTAASIKSNADAALKGMQQAVKDPSYPVPKADAEEHLKLVQAAVDNINKYLDTNSNISRGGTIKDYSKIWAATTAIQMAVVGSQDAIFNRTGSNAKQKSALGTALGQTPFLDISRATNPVVNVSPVTPSTTGAGFTINPRAAINMVPYLGGADTLTGSNLSNALKGAIKPVNSGITAAYK